MEPISSFSGMASGIQWRDMIERIMSMETARKLTPVQRELSTQERRQKSWSDFSGLVSNLNSAAAKIRDSGAFSAFTTTVDKTAAGKELLTASASSTAGPGTYSVEVVNLARAEKLNGSETTSTSTALGVSGEFWINGRRVELAGTESLTAVRDKINAVNSGSNATGVTASILSTGSTSHRLVLTADNTGTRGIEFVEGSTGALQSLGFVTGGTTANTSPTDGTKTQTQRFTSQSTPLASMLGVTSPPTVTTILVNGQKIEVDLENDTLLSVLNKVTEKNGANSASIVEESVGGRTLHRLSATGAVAVDPDANAADSQRVIDFLGFARLNRAAQITSGADSSVKVDGFTITDRSNTVTTAVSGVTLNLLQAELGTAVNVNIKRDLDTVAKSFEDFAKAYNAIQDFTDKQREAGAPLFASGSLRSMVSSLTGVMLGDVTGLDPEVTDFVRAGHAGIELDKKGRLQVDGEKLKAALTTNFTDVKKLFSQNGYATDGEVSYAGATSKTKPGEYQVVITAAASKASHTGGNLGASFAYTASNGTSDTLSITDAFTGTTVAYVVEQGKSLEDIVLELNARFGEEKVKLTAEASGNRLKISGSEYGSAASFTIGAGEAATRLQLTAGAHAGTDVAGTIGGHTATGAGQLLTADADHDAEGLAITYTGSAPKADAGKLTFVLGVAGAMSRAADPIIRSGDGTIDLQNQAIDRSIKSLNQRIADIQARLEVQRLTLTKQFIRMEEALGGLQAQGNWLSAQISSLQGKAA